MQSKCCASSASSASSLDADRGHFDVVAAADQLDDRRCAASRRLRRRAGSLRPRSMNVAMSPNVLSSCSFAIGFSRNATAPARSAFWRAVAGRDDVHRDVPRRRVALQVVEHGPAVHDRQVHVEHDRVGLVLVREREARVAAKRDDALEPALARHLEHGAGEVRSRLRRSGRRGRRRRCRHGRLAPRVGSEQRSGRAPSRLGPLQAPPFPPSRGSASVASSSARRVDARRRR